MRVSKFCLVALLFVSVNTLASEVEEFSFQRCLENNEANFCETKLMIKSLAISNELEKYNSSFESLCYKNTQECKLAVEAEKERFNSYKEDMEFVASELYKASKIDRKENIIDGLKTIPSQIDSLTHKFEVIEAASAAPSLRLSLK